MDNNGAIFSPALTAGAAKFTQEQGRCRLNVFCKLLHNLEKKFNQPE